jgi:hypothetical protein
MPFHLQHALAGDVDWLQSDGTAVKLCCVQVGITLGLILPPKPAHPSMQMEVDFTEYLAAVDLGWAVVLYLWLMVGVL